MEGGDSSVDVGENSKEVEPSANGKAECADIIEGSSDSPQPKKHKIDIFLKAAGNAPIMKRKKWSVDQEKTVGFVINFVRKYLHLETNESLFLYVNQTFAPSPDQMVKNLYDCFGSDGKLTLHYCQIQAWG